MVKIVTPVEHRRNASGDPWSADELSSLSKKLGRDILHRRHTGESLLSNREALIKCGFVVVACDPRLDPRFNWKFTGDDRHFTDGLPHIPFIIIPSKIKIPPLITPHYHLHN
ncbi:hypothetical protein HAX54_021681 [Datura stramonium]|uniref:Uncharacterized protein n=1 Tax=Datura stramonium TaxID=4076 RepID=A0ABS8S488_DATST|nr:hypothetical protein [Datura stramonium]